MAATITRELSATYGGLTVGGSSDYHLDGLFELDVSYDHFRFAADVSIISPTGTGDASFLSTCNSLVDAFRKPDQKLTITQNGQQVDEFDPASGTNTALRVTARCDKTADTEGPDSGRSRKYRITVEGGLPADLSGRSGRRSARVVVRDDASKRREISISGEYTAVGSSDARAVYLANIDTFSSSVLSTWGGTYNLENDVAEPQDDQDKVIRFSRVYREILLNEAEGTLNHAAITRQVMAVTVRDLGPDDSPVSFAVLNELGSPYVSSGSPARPVRIEVALNVSVDKDETTDLETLFAGTIKPWMIAHAQNVAGNSFSAIESVSPVYDYSRNVITASLRGMAAAGNVLSHVLTVQVTDRTGIRHLGVFGENPLWKHKLQDEREVFRIVRQITTVRKGSGGGAGGAGLGGGNGMGAPAGGKGGTGGLGAWVPVGQAGNGIGDSITGSPGTGASAQQDNEGADSSAQAGAAGVPDAIPFDGGVLADVGVAPPEVEGEAYWDRLNTDQEVKPGRIGITGYRFEVDRVVVTSIEGLRVVPPGPGGE